MTPLREHSSEAPGEGSSLLQDLWRSKAWRIYPLLLVYVSGVMVLVPFLPHMFTDYFASRRAGEALRCEGFRHGSEPPACRDAHSDVVWWSTWTGLASNTIVSVVASPALGSWSDCHGRKPLLAAATAASCLPVAVVLLYLSNGVPLLFYYVVQVFLSSLSSTTVSLAYLADSLAPEHRAPAFGLIMATFSLGAVFGPAAGASLAPASACWVALAACSGCCAYTLLLLPESLPAEAREAARRRRAAAARGAGGWAAAAAGAGSALRILLRSRLFRSLAAALMLYGACMEGLQDLLLQYCQLKLGFGVKEQSGIFIVFGVCGLLVQTVVLRVLLRGLGERRTLCAGLAAGAAQQLGLALARRKWEAYGALALGSLGGVAFPTVSSIKSRHAGGDEQGAVQGALAAARALASGVGPLFFAQLFAWFTKTDSPFPYFPGAPFILGTALMLAALGVALSIPADAEASHWEEQAAAAERAQAALQREHEGVRYALVVEEGAGGTGGTPAGGSYGGKDPGAQCPDSAASEASASASESPRSRLLQGRG